MESPERLHSGATRLEVLVNVVRHWLLTCLGCWEPRAGQRIACCASSENPYPGKICLKLLRNTGRLVKNLPSFAPKFPPNRSHRRGVVQENGVPLPFAGRPGTENGNISQSEVPPRHSLSRLATTTRTQSVSQGFICEIIQKKGLIRVR